MTLTRFRSERAMPAYQILSNSLGVQNANVQLATSETPDRFAETRPKCIAKNIQHGGGIVGNNNPPTTGLW
jgi:hypothetical protein